MTPTDTDPPPALIEPKRRASWMWALPVLAAVGAAVFLLVQAAADRGPRITIEFEDAAGLDEGAEIIYRGVSVGLVREVRLRSGAGTSGDAIEVLAELAPSAAGLAVAGSEFWIVRPRVGFDRISGLDTILSPRYIGVRPGPAGGRSARSFRGLDGPPAGVLEVGEGLAITLRAPTAGALTAGAPVLYRGVSVGTVGPARLAPDAASVLVDAVIEHPYGQLIRENTRFWNAGGISAEIGLRGIALQAGSLDAAVRGAIAFATPTDAGEPAPPGAVFDLWPSEPGDALRWTPPFDAGAGSEGG